MTQEQAKKIADLLHEIDWLKGYKELYAESNYRNSVHFKVLQPYGLNPKQVTISAKYTPRFIKVLDQIIEELELELADM
jgi:hypothetical protein